MWFPIDSMLELDLPTVSILGIVALDLVHLDWWYWSCDLNANQHKRLPGVVHKLVSAYDKV